MKTKVDLKEVQNKADHLKAMIYRPRPLRRIDDIKASFDDFYSELNGAYEIANDDPKPSWRDYIPSFFDFRKPVG